MCKYLEIEFSCSDRHRLRTDALCKCDSPLGCMAGDMELSDDAETDIEELGEESFKVLKVDGICGECAQKTTQELEVKNNMFKELEVTIEELGRDLDQLELGAKKEERQQQEMAAKAHERLCSHTTCQGRVGFSIDGRRGSYCRKHTCAAHDWGCISGVGGKLSNPKSSIYCAVHTCAKKGCGMRIAHDSAVYCCTHAHK